MLKDKKLGSRDHQTFPISSWESRGTIPPMPPPTPRNKGLIRPLFRERHWGGGFRRFLGYPRYNGTTALKLVHTIGTRKRYMACENHSPQSNWAWGFFLHHPFFNLKKTREKQMITSNHQILWQPTPEKQIWIWGRKNRKIPSLRCGNFGPKRSPPKASSPEFPLPWLPPRLGPKPPRHQRHQRQVDKVNITCV